MAESLPGSGAPGPDDLPGVDVSVAHIARMQIYWRGGKDNFAPDREAARYAMAAYPDLAHSVRANREFLDRSVRYLVAEGGVRQFLDIGTGLPSAGSVHEVAHDMAPESRCEHSKWADPGAMPGSARIRPASVSRAVGEHHGGGAGLAGLAGPGDADLVTRVILLDQ